MAFYSLFFFGFFCLLFFFYWFVVNRNVRLQNLLLLGAGYFFSTLTNWHLLLYLVVFSAVNFAIGIAIEKKNVAATKKRWLYLGIFLSIAGLVFFKYFNFFISSFKDALHLVGIEVSIQSLSIIVPLGISFFTLRAVSYLLDIYNGKSKATRDWVVFFIYISYFPSFSSGPIDRARTLIPQLEKKRVFDYNQATEGLSQIIWGLFKKVVIANNCMLVTNEIFDNYQAYPASSLLLGAILYTIQLYTDLSGYSDIAIGISRLMGIDITRNFDFPFFSQNIAEFWRKWHISLTSWLTDYVFTPTSIALRDYGKAGLILAIIVNFVVCGLWHGANWVYVVFGFIHGCLFIPLILRGALYKRKKIDKHKLLPSGKELLNMTGTFFLVALTLILFRSGTMHESYGYYNKLFSLSLLSDPISAIGKKYELWVAVIFSCIMLIVEWCFRDKEYGFPIRDIKSPALKFAIYYMLMFVIILFESAAENEFIYFKF